MAERRMFAKSIIDSDLFLDMPHTTQNLYFHLSMRADDDGFINNPKSIMRNIRCNDDDLRILITKQFIIPFDSGIIVIKHWKIHNYIQKDRYKPTVFKEEKSKLKLEKTNVYTECIQDVYKMDTQVRLGKVRLGKVRLEGDIEPDGSTHSPESEAKTYGRYNHVSLTDEQYLVLLETYGQSKLNQYIKKVDEYCQKHGRGYNDYEATIRSWIDEDKGKEPEHSYDLDEFAEFTLHHVPEIKGSNSQ